MARSDTPYALLTLVFGLAIFMAGRLSAPEATQTIIRETVQTAPSVIIVPSAAPLAVASTPAEPPIRLAVLPASPEAPKVAPTASQRPVMAPKTVETMPKPVPSVPVVLEETPEEVANPYKR
jgi:hypothetical protein